MVRVLSLQFRKAGIFLAVLLALFLGVFSVHAQEDTPLPTRRFDMPEGPIVRKVPPIDRIERPGRAAPPDTKPGEESEWEALWERNATPDPEEVERIKRRRREMEANGTNRTQDRSGGYYREQFPDDGDVIRRRTYVPYMKGGKLQRIPQDTYEPYP